METDILEMDDVAFALWGLKPTDSVTFEDLSAHIHPEDRGPVRAAFNAARAELGLYEIDFRIFVADTTRWISARGKGDDTEAAEQTLFGIFLDVSGRKHAEESHELLAGEMSHRVKNLLTIATGLTHITSRGAASAADMARDLTQRLSALGRAHDQVRPIAGSKPSGALLGDLLTILLEPYDEADLSGRVRVSVPRVAIGERSATALALVIHELATNSMKYGSLSTPDGRLNLTHSAEEEAAFVLRWIETGGPAIVGAPTTGGFGSKLIVRTVKADLGGSIDFDWAPGGVIITLTIDPERLPL
ncbi:histidine kinase [Sphingomonas sp. PAMC26645]|uniref:sensor histidine kinase n=1 Tax=Sphingomonas sp. PAMC26645 TaxID=2565555 RepID=UPI00109DFD61|nr:HWE histidine kinase domain-containing protein [Sphingomonas sp. PAMC26645]QCB42613.1 histidine kinase [Sphingomonas sp. PAMC26645]